MKVVSEDLTRGGQDERSVETLWVEVAMHRWNKGSNHTEGKEEANWTECEMLCLVCISVLFMEVPFYIDAKKVVRWV